MIEKRKQYSQDTFLQVQDNVFVERGMVYSNQKVHLTPLKFSHKSLGSSKKILQLGMILKTFKSYCNYNVTVMIVVTAVNSMSIPRFIRSDQLRSAHRLNTIPYKKSLQTSNCLYP